MTTNQKDDREFNNQRRTERECTYHLVVVVDPRFFGSSGVVDIGLDVVPPITPSFVLHVELIGDQHADHRPHLLQHRQVRVLQIDQTRVLVLCPHLLDQLLVVRSDVAAVLVAVHSESRGLHHELAGVAEQRLNDGSLAVLRNRVIANDVDIEERLLSHRRVECDINDRGGVRDGSRCRESMGSK